MKTLKITLSMVSFLFIMLFLNSCNKEEILPEEVETPAVAMDPETEKMKDHLVSAYGFGRAEISETQNELIAEGDIAFPKQDFWELYGQPQPETGSYKHYRHTNLLNYGTRVYVRFASNIPAAWKTAYLNAMSRWNTVLLGSGGCSMGVMFDECNSTDCAMILGMNVTYESLGTLQRGTVALTQFPTVNGNPGSSSKINSGYIGIQLSASQKLFVAVHELGHAIGMRHTDSGEGVLIYTNNSTCNSKNDPNSVMRNTISSFYGFSACDAEAIFSIYPCIHN